MAITITVETGAVVAQANSFVSMADAITYAGQRGITLPSDDTTAALVIRSGGWLNTYEPRAKGTRVSSVQTMFYPRENVYVYPRDLTPYPDNLVHPNVILAQCELIMAMKAGANPDQATVGGTLGLKMKKVDVLQREWFSPAEMKAGNGNWNSDEIPMVEALLEPLLEGGMKFRTKRI